MFVYEKFIKAIKTFSIYYSLKKNLSRSGSWNGFVAVVSRCVGTRKIWCLNESVLTLDFFVLTYI